jgi:hypothetical protein
MAHTIDVQVQHLDEILDCRRRTFGHANLQIP